MELNYSQIFNSKVLDQIKSYCTLNNVEDADKFISDCFTQGFNIEKYGLLGKTLNDSEKHLKTGGVEEKHITKEVIVEKRVEIPVEVIKEVEKIVEVIKEVPIERVVEKEVYITDNTQVNELLLKIQELENGMSKKNEELDELRRSLDISKQNVGDDRVKLLQETIVNLNTEIRSLKKQIKELENKTFEQSQSGEYVRARFHASSNLKD